MKHLFIFIMFVLSLFVMIPSVVTIGISNMQDKKRIDFDTYRSGCFVKVKGKTVELEHYIMGVLPTCISLDCEDETLKAQTVIIRTQIREKMGNQKTIDAKELGYQYKDNGQLKKSFGTGRYIDKKRRIEKAVVDTLGKCIIYKGNLAKVYYHELSVGTTLNAKEWFQRDIPYLKETDAFKDTEADEYVDTREYTYRKIVDKIAHDFGIKVTTKRAKESLIILHATKNGYVKMVRIGKEQISGVKFAKAFSLPSTNFYFEHYDGKFRILTLGKGNGLGMSQNMADELARKKKTYKEILTYFFQKTKIKTFRE